MMTILAESLRARRARLFILTLAAGLLALTGCAAPSVDPTATLMPVPEGTPVAASPAAFASQNEPDVAASTRPGQGYPAPGGEGYPAPDVSTPLPTWTPAPYDAGAYPAPAATAAEGLALSGFVFMPIIGEGKLADAPTAELPAPAPTEPLAPTETPAPVAPEALGPLPSPTPINVVDFESAAADLAGKGQQLAYNKIGFHVTFLEEADQLDAYMQRLDAEGVPFFLKSVDNAEPLYKAQELMKASGVPHTLVYRSTKYDVPDYTLDPVQAAETYWELEKAIWPPELDPGLVWFETMNELDKTRADWLAQFSLRTAQLALRDGYKWAAFGWAAGEPEPADWESPAMLDLLRLIGEHPDHLAIALHEYSYITSDIAHEYPYKVGRFLHLFDAADRHGIPRPTVLITEWGWTYDTLPDEPLAMEDVTWAARLYGAYPQVKGAALWNLGKLDDQLLPLNTQARELIDNLMAFSLDSYFSAPALPQQASTDPGQFLPAPPVE